MLKHMPIGVLLGALGVDNHHHLLQPIRRNDDDFDGIAEDDITGIDDDPADLDRAAKGDDG